MTHKEYADGLRLIADFYEANAEMEFPHGDKFYVFSTFREDFLRNVACLARGGKVTKSADDATHNDYAKFRATRQFGAITFEVNIERKQVCRLVRPAEYECPDSLLEAAAEYTEAV